MRDRNWRTGEGFTNGLTQQDIEYLVSEFRACEQQMLEDDVLAAFYDGEKGYEMGYSVALDAAETAVAEALKERMLMAGCSPNTMRAPLFAIRALKEKK